MWTPGYWAYGPDGYYWVPGAWVPAPYEGALWTPGYWGYDSDLYVWHAGYWGPHVGYYGGVNYGFGYMGIGFVGGMWREHTFVYNTAVVRVNSVYIHNTYVDRTIVERNTIANDRHVAFSGGPGGINHPPAPEERLAMREQHLAPTSYQAQHVNSAMSDHNAYARFNGGRPQNVAVAQPLAREQHLGPTGTRPMTPNTFNNNRGGANPSYGQPNGQSRPDFQNHQAPSQEYHAAPSAAQNQPRNEYRPPTQNENHPAPQSQPRTEAHPQAQSHPKNEHDKN